MNHDPDRTAGRTLEQVLEVRQEPVDADDLGVQILSSREREQLAVQLRAAGDTRLRGFDQSVRPLVAGDAAAEHVEAAADHEQQIVEVVRDAAGQLTHRLHLLRLAQLFLDGPLVGDVRHDAGDADRPVAVVIGGPPDVDPADAAVAHAPDAMFELDASPVSGLHEGPFDRLAVGRKEMGDGVFQRPSRRGLVVAEDLVVPRRTSGRAADKIELPVAHAGRLQREPEAVLHATTLVDLAAEAGVRVGELAAARPVRRKVRHDRADETRRMLVRLQFDERDVDRDVGRAAAE